VGRGRGREKKEKEELKKEDEDEEKEEDKRSWSYNPHQEHTSSDLKLLPRFHFLKVSTTFNSTKLETKLLTWAFGRRYTSKL
jgi:hypothetical protein